MAGDPQILTLKQVAAVLHVHTVTIYRLIKKGKLHPFRVGRIWRFNNEEIAAILNQRGGGR